MFPYCDNFPSRDRNRLSVYSRPPARIGSFAPPTLGVERAADNREGVGILWKHYSDSLVREWLRRKPAATPSNRSLKVAAQLKYDANSVRRDTATQPRTCPRRRGHATRPTSRAIPLPQIGHQLHRPSSSPRRPRRAVRPTVIVRAVDCGHNLPLAESIGKSVYRRPVRRLAFDSVDDYALEDTILFSRAMRRPRRAGPT